MRNPVSGAAGPGALLAAFAAGVLLAGCGEPVEEIAFREGMTTVVTVRVVAPDTETARRALDAAWAELAEAAQRLDRHALEAAAGVGGEAPVPSDVALINKDAGLSHARVDPLTASCVAAAKDVWDLTDGAFDPTVGPVLDLWRAAAEADRLPTDEEVAAAAALVGMDDVEVLILESQGPPGPGERGSGEESFGDVLHLVGLMKTGMELDLGGIAKGYIAGRMAERMRQAGALAALVDAGGDVYAVARRPARLVSPGRDPRWSVGIQDPRYPDQRGRLYTALYLEDQAAVTSGHYERGFTIGGRHFSHILDPRTGRPVDTRLASVTVVAADPALADGLATALAVIGVEKGMALVESLDGVECLLLETPPEAVEGAPPEAAALTAHRSSGFAALEFDPGQAEWPQPPAP